MQTLPTDLILFLGYTIASVVGLLIMKSRLPHATTAWEDGQLFTLPTLMVGLGATLYIASFRLHRGGATLRRPRGGVTAARFRRCG
jgi:hypothetical protein